MYKLSFYVPTSHLETVKNALFAAGAGRYQAYDQCCWQVPGQGQFRPLENSQPYLGQAHRLEKVVEYKVEMICEEAVIKDAVQVLLGAHPYEQPAYEIYRILSMEDV
ncbi:MAG: NGG1p interacting factor NIF3 [Methylosarcina sp.]